MKTSDVSLLCLSLAVLPLLLSGGCTKEAAARGAEPVYTWPRWGGPDGNWVSRETGWNPAALNREAPVSLDGGYRRRVLERGHPGGTPLHHGRRQHHPNRHLPECRHRQGDLEKHPNVPGQTPAEHARHRRGLAVHPEQRRAGELSEHQQWKNPLVETLGQGVGDAATELGVRGITGRGGHLLMLPATVTGLALEKGQRKPDLEEPLHGSSTTTQPAGQHLRHPDALHQGQSAAPAAVQLGSAYTRSKWKRAPRTGSCDIQTPILSRTSGTTSSTRVFVDGRVFISSAYGMGCALLDVSTGRPHTVWQNDKPVRRRSPLPPRRRVPVRVS